MMESIYTATFASSTRCLPHVRGFVAALAHEAHFSDAFVTHLTLAVDEAFANVVEHAYKGEEGRPVDVIVVVDPDCFTVCIRDQGKAFDPGFYTEPDLRRAIKRGEAGGLGVFLMRSLMDRVVYRSRGPVNEVSLTKYRAAS